MSQAIVQPDMATVKYYSAKLRLEPDEELFAILDDALFRLALADAEIGDWPEAVTNSSRVNAASTKAAVEAILAWRAERGVSRQPVSVGWSREFLLEIKERVPIEEEIALAIGLQPRGRALYGCCPFHDDSDPSLVVWPDRRRWKCFGCHLGGDAFTWIQLWVPTDFRGAVAYLSARAGLPLPDRRASRGRELRVREVRCG